MIVQEELLFSSEVRFENKIFTATFTDVPTILKWLNDRPFGRGIECALDSPTTSGGAWRTWIVWEYAEKGME